MQERDWKKYSRKVILNKSYTVTLPKKIRILCNIEPSKEVAVFLNSGKIYIKNIFGKSLENQMVVSTKGSVHIPREIRRLKNIEHGTIFEVFYDSENESIKLIPQ